MCGIEIELPSVNIQKRYADVYNANVNNSNLRAKTSNICLVLIKGALEEA